jgi:hypothetical protein
VDKRELNYALIEWDCVHNCFFVILVILVIVLLL